MQTFDDSVEINGNNIMIIDNNKKIFLPFYLLQVFIDTPLGGSREKKTKFL